ncbi:hypothetical protein [Galactobacter valiniphilus]|uniref:hypothetical protein n=1 Tax=Galactobacter valiniphilus TaxID=2676122 RepID=UPI003734FC35
MNDDELQNALADVHDMAELLHALRVLEGEVEDLLGEAIRHAHGRGLSQVLIAEAAALTRGRVNQVVKSDPMGLSPERASRRAYEVSERPGDALRVHRRSFTGQMAMPPYRKRRASGS